MARRESNFEKQMRGAHEASQALRKKIEEELPGGVWIQDCYTVDIGEEQLEFIVRKLEQASAKSPPPGARKLGPREVIEKGDLVWDEDDWLTVHHTVVGEMAGDDDAQPVYRPGLKTRTWMSSKKLIDNALRTGEAEDRHWSRDDVLRRMCEFLELRGYHQDWCQWMEIRAKLEHLEALKEKKADG